MQHPINATQFDRSALSSTELNCDALCCSAPVVEYDCVRPCEVDAESPTARGEDEAEQLRVGVEAVHEALSALYACGGQEKGRVSYNGADMESELSIAKGRCWCGRGEIEAREGRK